MISTIILTLSMFLLSGCGSENTAKNVVESLKQKDYFTAGEIYDEAISDLSEEKKEKVDEAVSKEIIEFLDNRYKEMESDRSKEASFYSSLDKIIEIGINDNTLNNKIESYEQERAEKDDGVGGVEDVLIQENGSAYQEQLAFDFEKDMENFNALLNKNQDSLSPIISAVSEESDIGEESFSLMLTNLNATILYIKNMQDYSELEKYKETLEHFTEGSAHLIGAYAHFNSFYESNYNNKKLFFMAVDSYNKAIEEFTITGSMYAQEKQQQ